MSIEMVYRCNSAWFHGFLSESDNVIYNQMQIHKVKDVKKIDEYEHSSKFRYGIISKCLDQCIKKYGLDELYIKKYSPQEKICSMCTKKCKSDKVIGCNMFTMNNGKTRGENYWTI
jgi:hypothetical protein